MSSLYSMHSLSTYNPPFVFHHLATKALVLNDELDESAWLLSLSSIIEKLGTWQLRESPWIRRWLSLDQDILHC